MQVPVVSQDSYATLTYSLPNTHEDSLKKTSKVFDSLKTLDTSEKVGTTFLNNLTAQLEAVKAAEDSARRAGFVHSIMQNMPKHEILISPPDGLTPVKFENILTEQIASNVYLELFYNEYNEATIKNSQVLARFYHYKDLKLNPELAVYREKYLMIKSYKTGSVFEKATQIFKSALYSLYNVAGLVSTNESKIHNLKKKVCEFHKQQTDLIQKELIV